MQVNHFVERTCCPCCSSDRTKSLKSLDYDDPKLQRYLHEYYSPQGHIEVEYLIGARYEVLECAECTLVYQRFIPDDELMFRLYEHWIDPELVFERYEKTYPYSYYFDYAATVDTLVRYFGKKPREIRVLDFAMGWGNWLRMASAFGLQVFGCELSPSRASYAQKHNVGVIEWKDIPGGDYDFINLDQVLEHVADPPGLLEHLKTGLAEGGLLRISVPDGRDIKRKLMVENWTADKDDPDSMYEIAPLEHINCFTNYSLTRLASSVGLVPQKLRYHLFNEGLIKENLLQQVMLSLRSLKWLVQRLTGSYYRPYESTDIYFTVKARR